MAFKALVENRFQTKITTLYSDNGGEFVALRQFLSTHGISHLTSPPHTPEHNGISERKHRHIVEIGLTLLHQASLPPQYWTYAFAAAVYLINRLPSPVIANTSPYARLFKQPPNYLKLRIFGCLCFPWLRPYTKNKLECRSAPCVFLGYSLTQSAYLCLDKSTGRIYTSRHVQFVETSFPFALSSPPPPTPMTPALSDCPSDSTSTLIPVHGPPLVTAPSSAAPTLSPHQSPVIPTPSGSSSASQAHDEHDAPNSSQLGSGNSNSTCPLSGPTIAHDNSPQASHSNPSSTSNPTSPSHSPSLPETEPQSSSSSAASPSPPPPPLQPIRHQMQTRSKNNITKPKIKYSLTTTTTPAQPFIPTTVSQAMRDPNWRHAMGEEINSQIRHHTFDLVPPAPNQNVIATKWIFTLKYLPDGSLDRYKARWVARGFTQQYGLDYSETFSPVVKSITIRVVLQLAVNHNWGIKQIDVNTAFLQGTLHEEAYVTQPEGFVDKDRPHYVCRLRKALYGLKQAPRAWYQELKSFLCDLGFLNSLADTSVFTYIAGANVVFVLVYVDDIIVTGSTPTILRDFIATLSGRFSLKDPTDITYFLGIEANRTSRGLHLMQRRYVLDLLTKTNMLGAKPVTTPMAVSPHLSLSSGVLLSDPKEYRTVVGSLQYLSFTRPDIAYCVNRLSQFMHRPTNLHWQAVKRLLRYLAGTTSHGIYLRPNSPLSLHAYSDADWAGDTDDFVSTNGFLIYLGSTPIAWSSKKQKGVARSSTEAEYRAVANTAAELRWVCSLLTELGTTLPAIPVVYCDNVGATYLSANPVFHSRMKHLALDYHFIRDNVQAGLLRVTHISTKDQLADSLTKPLSRPRFIELNDKIGVQQLPPS
uniref:Retrovirus-related Pol polyprotein from transposon TNT 1-94 n=2 Tax=Noccaea caerulescens TaxID=107243 RepID=A0A1J3HVA2_NOCCA